MYGLLYIRFMAAEERRSWITLVVSVVAYAVYLVVVLGRKSGSALVDVAYVRPLVWTVVGAVVVAIVLNIVSAVVFSKEVEKKDQRDREIYRFGEHAGHSFVVVGAVAALLLAMAEVAHFWIANVVYLAFVLSALAENVAKIAAYRKGFGPW
ncbi:hypothetical protein [Umezawaea tangerina]|nr:hypothetical protein [Umezawaea tangerina]